jgi:hypothetical protein
MFNIKKNGVITNSGPNQEWLDRHIKMGTFGCPASQNDDATWNISTQNEDGTWSEPTRNDDATWNPAEYQIEFVDDSIKTQVQLNYESREYIKSTDWYAIRFAETGVAIPTEVLTLRAAARAAVVE